VGGGCGEEIEGIEGGGRRQTYVPAPSWSVLESVSQMYLCLRKRGPGEVEDFFGVDECVKAGDEEDVVFKLKGVEGCKECIEVVNCEPLGGLGALVVFPVGAETKRSNWLTGHRVLLMWHHILMAEVVPLTLL
jgi:hypothetical protein